MFSYSRGEVKALIFILHIRGVQTFTFAVPVASCNKRQKNISWLFVCSIPTHLRTVNVIKVRNLQFIFLLNKLHQRICQIMYYINQIMYETKDKNYGLRSLDLFIASATFVENVSRK